MGTGFLEIHVTTGDEALPVAAAHITVEDADGALLFEANTDASGMTQTFEIKAPDAKLTLDPNFKGPAYATVTVNVSADGFVTEHIRGVEIVDTQTAILPVHLHPFARKVRQTADNYIDIPEIGLLTREANEAHWEAPATMPPTRLRVLPEVVIPDFITVHLGVPSNTAARNVRVRFADYIKNVTYKKRPKVPICKHYIIYCNKYQLKSSKISPPTFPYQGFKSGDFSPCEKYYSSLVQRAKNIIDFGYSANCDEWP